MDRKEHTRSAIRRWLYRFYGTAVVKVVFIVLFTFSIAAVSADAQDTTQSPGTKRLERYALVLGSCLTYSLLDYVGYNVLVQSDKTRTAQIFALHLFDAALGAGINYFLYKTCGLPSAISFDLIWWTWGLDLGFSGWGDLINPAFPWINRTESSLNSAHWGSNSINWAGWTPIGLLRKPGSPIALSSLYAQAIIGFSISMAILW